MKKIILVLALVSIITAPCLASSNLSPFELKSGEKLKMYDKHGSYQGYYKKDGNKIKEYNRSGSYQGYYKQDGSKVKKYNKNGSYDGYYKK